MKDYYFTGQNKGPFFYFYYGKIIKTSSGEKMNENYHIIEGFNFDKSDGLNAGKFKVPQRYDKHDIPEQYDVSKKQAQHGVVKLILGDNEDD